MFRLRPLANGLRTDHPVPDLPFVDDAHIPIEKGPDAIEAIGRGVAEGMWGRCDRDRNGGWLAFTTDPLRTDLGWSVRYHPEHGMTVLLLDDRDTAALHEYWWGPPLLFRSGGYWWDGVTWYRPQQVWDGASERYERRPVRAATTIHAADLIDDHTDPARGKILKVANFDNEASAVQGWPDHLAKWATARAERGDGLPLQECVVRLTAPEFTGDHLVGIPEMAELAGITSSTLRAYISRGENSIPLPQATVGGRSMWARPVAEDWAEARSKSSEGVEAAMASGDNDPLSRGAADVRERFTENFTRTLWERPAVRKRWTLRHRNEEAVRELANELAWKVAASLNRIIPTEELGSTIRHAVLDELANGGDSHEDLVDNQDWQFVGITLPVSRMLGWHVRHFPHSAQTVINDIIGEAERRLDMPRQVTIRSLSNALTMDSGLDGKTLEAYLKLVLPPENAS